MSLAGIDSLADLAEFIDSSPYTAAGTTDINGNTIDMDDAFGCVFVASMGTITDTAVGGLKVQEADDGSTWTDVTGATQAHATTGDSDKIIIVQVRRPSFTKRYIRGVVERGTANSVLNACIAVKYGQNAKPVTQGDNSSTTVVGTIKL